ncbi:Transglutaminase-like superfamily protein [Lysinibacillus sp. AC-3]|uniref:transglutaminase domain-containing protein n=1 Tax=unclassified Lysinibacillus TaxID=2636778 RepID=UPI0009D1E4D1|nr:MULTISPECIES: transglutaminase domain-containing protein [unclassified Lysinibacillus]SKB68990.1 Transglutaminase-like superfamily protein [Lysinibacillus sp. AC-3]
MKKSILLIFLLILLSTLSACSAAIKVAEVLLQDELESEEEESSMDPKELANKAPSAEYSAEDLFSTTLFKEDPAMLQFSKKIEKHISSFDPNFTVMYRGKLDWDTFEEQINDLYNILNFVNPYTTGYIQDYNWEAWEVDNGYEVEFDFTYITDAKKEKKVDAYVQDFAKKFITDDMDDFHRAKAVNDFVVQLATYTEKGDSQGQAVYELISKETGVCQAYTLLAYRLFLATGLDAKYVYGYSDNQLHAWNLVSVNGDWYHIDTTWNDITPSEPYAISYAYFLVNDEKLSEDHIWANENYFAATSNTYDFMHDMWYTDTIGNVIYYNSLDDDMVYAYDLATKQNRQVTETACYYLAAFEDAIYCSDYDNAGFLTKIFINDGSEEVLLEEEVLNLFVDDKGVLFYETIDGEKHSQTL